MALPSRTHPNNEKALEILYSKLLPIYRVFVVERRGTVIFEICLGKQALGSADENEPQPGL